MGMTKIRLKLKLKRLLLGTTLVSSVLLGNLLWAGGDSQQGKTFEGALSGSKIGELGELYGVSAAIRPHKNWRFRAGYTQFDYVNQRTLGTIQFNEALDQQNITLNADWYPYSWLGFYTTLGLARTGGDYTLTGTADATTNYNLQGTLYNGTQLGTLNGTVTTRDIVPYIGIGYTFYLKPQRRQGWFAQAEVGSLFGLDPTLSLQSTNPSNIATLPADLQATADNEAAKLDDRYVIYGLSIGYRF